MNSSPILWSVATARSAVKESSRSRARGLLGTETFAHIISSHRETRVSTSHLQSVAATLLPVGNGRLLTTRIERTRTQRALLVVSAFLPTRRDMWSGILNLTGYLSRWSFRTLLQSFQESSCVLRILFSPHVLSSSVLHVRNMQQRSVRSHGKNHRNHG